jgi:SIT4-associating protein SAP185/190
MTTSLGEIHPLTFERYRITELYAELLHCSNMALLNRAPGEGPQYSEDGSLLGGIDGLQILARTLQGGDSTEAGNGSTDDAETSTKEEDTSVATEKEEDGSKTMDLDSSTSEASISTEPTSTADTAAAEVEKTTSGEEATIKLAAPPTGTRSHSREASTRHGQSSSGGDESHSSSGGQEDTDDEALLNEVSLGESNSTVITTEASATSVESSETSASSNSTPSDEIPHHTEDPVSSKVKAESEPTKENDPDDARSIASAISGMSLAALTSPHPSGPPSPIDDSRELVVGDMLKKKFLDCNVIPSILGLFFDCPWNNFLHNVVYDILQQFFNGRMDVGLNRRLTLAVFNSGALTDKIMEGHQRNEESMAGPRRIRMGYMGHMNLIAEEVVKLLERYPFEIAASVADSIAQPEWDEFVNESLRENREKESAPLAGGRPTMNRAMALSTADNDLGDDREVGGDNNTFASYLSSQIGASGSDDDDSDEDTSWLSQVDNVVSRNEFDVSIPLKEKGKDLLFTLTIGFFLTFFYLLSLNHLLRTLSNLPKILHPLSRLEATTMTGVLSLIQEEPSPHLTGLVPADQELQTLLRALERATCSLRISLLLIGLPSSEEKALLNL